VLPHWAPPSSRPRFSQKKELDALLVVEGWPAAFPRLAQRAPSAALDGVLGQDVRPVLLERHLSSQPFGPSEASWSTAFLARRAGCCQQHFSVGEPPGRLFRRSFLPWLLISGSRDDLNQYTLYRENSDQHTTRFSRLIRVWSRIIHLLWSA
jgi:hypothetical protein